MNDIDRGRYSLIINVYDVNEFIQRDSDGEWKCYREKELAIIELPKGIIITGTEGVHEIENIITDSIKILVVKNKNDNSIPIFPQAETVVQLSEIKEKCKRKETTLGQFIRRFGGRLESNYKILLKSIEELGGDPRLYPRDEGDQNEIKTCDNNGS